MINDVYILFFIDARNSLKVYEEKNDELQKIIEERDRVIATKERIVDGKDQELKMQFDKLTSVKYELQTKIDKLQKSLDGAQNDLKEETNLKNQRNKVILETRANLEERQKELNHEVKSRLKNIKEKDDAISELNIAKLKLEDLEQEKKNDKEEIENLRKKIEEQNDELSKGVEFRHDAIGKKSFIYMSKCSLLKELRKKYTKKCEKVLDLACKNFL